MKFIVAVTALMLFQAVALAAPPATLPLAATRPAIAAPPQTLVATVTQVEGLVQVRENDDQPWKICTVGMKVGQGATFRTGGRSAVQFVIPPHDTITLDRLGTFKILEAVRDRGVVKTDIGMKYGRTRYDIEAAGVEHRAVIRSPGSTLAIRGTDVTYEDQAPWIPTAVSREGRAEFRNYRRQFVAFGGRKFASIAADKNSPAQQAIAGTKADPRGEFAGRTDSEDALTLSLQSVGGVDAQGLQAIQSLAKLGGFRGTFAGVPPVPGPLDFQLSWNSTAATPGTTNLDFRVTDPLGNTASALNPVIGTGSATGMHFGDDTGLSGSGAEGVTWGLFFPAGTYTFTATHAGGDDAQVTIVAFQGPSSDEIKSVGLDPASPLVLQAGDSISDTVTVSSTGRRSARGNTSAVRPAKSKRR